MEGFEFLMSPRDQQALSRDGAVRVDYVDDGWGKGFYLSTARAERCAI